MKYAFVLILIGLVFWVWRSQRLSGKKKSGEQGNAKSAKSAHTLGPSTEIVACAICKVHLPRPDAVLGAHGVYCSAAHKQQAGD